MGWFDGVSEVGSTHSSHKKHRSHHSSGHKKHHSSGASVFGGASLEDWKHNASGRNTSKTSFFSVGGSRSPSSAYKRSPRRGYIARMYSQFRHLIRKLIHYLKHNPLKVFFLVIMPLITGGALTTLLAKFGLRLPHSLSKMITKLGGGSGSSSSYEFERKSYSGPLESVGAIGEMMGGLSGLGSVMSVAKMFM